MKYNIKMHILDHATYFINKLENNDKYYTHFNTSVCLSYFIRNDIKTQDEINKTMINILKNIEQKKIKVKEKNGIYSRKNGTVVQRYRTRTLNFDTILSAYHSRHFDSTKSVNPHLHFLFPKQARMGKNFIYLKKAIAEEAIKHKIKFNFMEKQKNTGLSQKQLIRIESLSWLLNQGDYVKIKQYISNSTKLIKTLDLLQMHYQNTQNISYFLKTISILNQRLQELDIDFVYKNINLKESIYFFLDETQKNMLYNLENGQIVKLDLSRVLDREILKKAHHFQSTAMDVLSKKFNLVNLSPHQLKYRRNNDKTSPKSPGMSSFRKLVIQDMRDALAYASSEKDWKNILIKMGYSKVSINTSKTASNRVKTGITVTTPKKSKLSIPFHCMRLSFKKITQIMVHNKKRNRRKENYTNRFDAYKKRKKRDYEIWKKYSVQMQLLLQIYSKDHANYKEVDKTLLKKLATKYTIDTSQMYKITTYQNRTTTIVDNASAITLKKSSSNREKTISDMLDIAILKCWKLSSLSIRGSPEFVSIAKRQIADRQNRRKAPMKTKASRLEI